MGLIEPTDDSLMIISPQTVKKLQGIKPPDTLESTKFRQIGNILT